MSEIPNRRGVQEANWIKAMSRRRIVNAYATWNTFSEAEKLCFDRFLPKCAKVLDLGCGTGRALEGLKNNLKSYLGVDASESMICTAKAKHPGIRFIIEDIVKFDCEPSSYDVILLLHNVIDILNPRIRRLQLLRNAHRFLKRDGVIIASSHLGKVGQAYGYFREDYHGSYIYNYRSSLPQWCREVEAAGFSVLLAMRDFRGQMCDWAYIAAKKV